MARKSFLENRIKVLEDMIKTRDGIVIEQAGIINGLQQDIKDLKTKKKEKVSNGI